MKVAMNFNGNASIVLTPETARERMLLSCAVDGRPTAAIKAGSEDGSIVLVVEDFQGLAHSAASSSETVAKTPQLIS